MTGGSGVALGLPENFRARGLLRFAGHAIDLPAVAGGMAIVSGSCSRATNAQVADWLREGAAAFRVVFQLLPRGQERDEVRRELRALFRREVFVAGTHGESIRFALVQYQKSLKAEFGDIIARESKELGALKLGGSEAMQPPRR